MSEMKRTVNFLFECGIKVKSFSLSGQCLQVGVNMLGIFSGVQKCNFAIKGENIRTFN